MARRLATLSLSLLAMTACQPVGDSGPAAPSQAVPEPGIVASAAALVGEYRVAGVDGAGIDLPHGMTAAISADRIEVTSDCIRLAWSYRFESGALATERVPVPSCRRTLLPEEAAVAAAFDGAGLVRRTTANGLEFAGGDGSVLLFAQ